MKTARRKFGDRGEDRAVAFFELKGFTVIDRNWSCRVGEIDLVCKKDRITHFIEVKTRRSKMYGNPEESITPAKLANLQRAVMVYMNQKQLSWENIQVDALAILAEPGKEPEYHYIEHIFG